MLAIAAAIDDLADQHLAEVLREAADYLRARARYEQAEPMDWRALRLREQALGSEHLHVASCVDGLATLFFRQGKYEQAEPLYRRALQIWGQTLGPHHPLVAHALMGLGISLPSKGEMSKQRRCIGRPCTSGNKPWDHTIQK